MTPQEFNTAYRPTADYISLRTGLDPIMLEAQWWNETGAGVSWAGAPYNLANIEDNGKVVQYSSLTEFANAYIATIHTPAFGYPAVLAATNAVDQLAALVKSDWSAGHYGGSLEAEYALLEEFELTPTEHGWLEELFTEYLTRKQAIPPDLAAGPPATVLDWITANTEKLKNLPSGGGSEPPEPAEPKDVVLHIPAQDILGTIS